MEGGGSLTAGVVTAVLSSFVNGSTFVLHKKGILRSRCGGGSHLKDVVWWSGTVSMIVGQMGNMAAYNMAPAVIVTPLGALGVLFGAVLASWLLDERLSGVGKLGCVLCCFGSVLLIANAPKSEVTSVDELEDRLLDPVFVVYVVLVLALLLALVLLVAPVHGQTNVLVYVSICSLFGTFTVPCSKGLGLLAPVVLGGGPSGSRALILFLPLLVVLGASVLSQFYFITEALQHFSSNAFEAVYFVAFTACVLVSSALLFKEWAALSGTRGLAVLGGLAAAGVGVALLRMSQLFTEKEHQKKKD